MIQSCKAFGGEIAELVATSGAARQVHFAGIVDDVENYLRAADIFILASNREGTPNSVLEAMATGLPCLVTPYLGISAGIGQPGEHYQLVDRDHGAIAAALTGLLQNDRCGKMRSATGADATWRKTSTSNTAWIAMLHSMKNSQPLPRSGASTSIHQAFFLRHQFRAS